MRFIRFLLFNILMFSSALAAVNLNFADKLTLESVKGIGPKKAEAIIQYRKEHGPFKTVEELDNVKGFGPKTVAKVKKDFTVGK